MFFWAHFTHFKNGTSTYLQGAGSSNLLVCSALQGSKLPQDELIAAKQLELPGT